MEYKFRGIGIKTKEMKFGHIVETKNGTFIVNNINCGPNSINYYPVNPKTIGAYTGVKDINKKESYLGDVLKKQVSKWLSEKQREVCLKERSFYIVKKESDSNNMYLEYNFNIREYWESNNVKLRNIEDLEIVGNIFENADIIKREV